MRKSGWHPFIHLTISDWGKKKTTGGFFETAPFLDRDFLADGFQYPLANVCRTMEIIIFNVTTHYKLQFSIATCILNYQRVGFIVHSLLSLGEKDIKTNPRMVEWSPRNSGESCWDAQVFFTELSASEATLGGDIMPTLGCCEVTHPEEKRNCW